MFILLKVSGKSGITHRKRSCSLTLRLLKFMSMTTVGLYKRRQPYVFFYNEIST